jgi:GT2 family glycosyltransferase
MKANDEILLVAHTASGFDSKGFSKIQNLRQLRVITYNKKFNYSKMVNFAAAHSSKDALLFLNDDIELESGSPLEKMRQALADSRVGVAGLVAKYPNGRVQHVGVALGCGLGTCHPFRGQVNLEGLMEKLPSSFEVSAVTFAAAATRREDFIALSGLDERLSFGLQDVDFCIRSKKNGKEIICMSHPGVIHHESATRGNPRGPKNLVRSTIDTILFRLKHTKLKENYFPPSLSK